MISSLIQQLPTLSAPSTYNHGESTQTLSLLSTLRVLKY